MQRLEKQMWWVYRVVADVKWLLGYLPGEDAPEAMAEAQRVYPDIPREQLVVEKDGEDTHV